MQTINLKIMVKRIHWIFQRFFNNNVLSVYILDKWNICIQPFLFYLRMYAIEIKWFRRSSGGSEIAWQTLGKGQRIPEISNVLLTGSLALRRILSGFWKVPEGQEKVWGFLNKIFQPKFLSKKSVWDCSMSPWQLC